MENKKQDELQNAVFVLKNDLLKYANHIAENDSNGKTSIVETIYNLLLQMKQKENNGEDTREMRRAFAGVPLELHGQVLKSFIESFYISNHLTNKITAPTPETNRIVEDLMQVTDNFYQVNHSVLSPFESVYLVTRALVKPDNLRNSQWHDEASLFIGDLSAQRRALVDFLKQYDSKYHAKIREGENFEG